MASNKINMALGKIRHPVRAAALLYTPPNFILRGPIYMVFVIMIAGLTYSILASSDTVVTAPLTLQRQSISIQAVNGGLVESVSVKENDSVSSGDELASIQEKIHAISTPEQEALQREIRDIQDKRDTQVADFKHKISQLKSQREDLVSKRSTGLNTLQARVSQVELQLRTAKNNRAGLDDRLRAARADADSKKRLAANRDIPAAEAQRAEQVVNELERAIANAEGQIQSVGHSLEIAKGELAQATDEHALDRFDSDIAETERDLNDYVKKTDDRVADLAQRMENAQVLVPGVRYDDGRARYSAPVSGVVSTVPVQRGQIINPGAAIATIIRDTAPLEARVLVQNKDIGHLKLGQGVRIKYYAYPYQRYGIQSGNITSISARPSTVAKEESLYVVTVSLESETISEIGVERNAATLKTLEIGLLGSAEIATGKKRFIEMIFSPASRFFRGGEDE